MHRGVRGGKKRSGRVQRVVNRLKTKAIILALDFNELQNVNMLWW